MQWLENNQDPFWAKYRSGSKTDRELKDQTLKLEAEGKLTNLSKQPSLSAYIDPEHVEQPWRQVIPTEHMPAMNEINLRLNQFLHEVGGDKDYVIIPIINSTVRSIEYNNSLSNSSPTSAHLGYSAIDFSETSYLVQKVGPDGKIIRYVETQNSEVFANALSKVFYEMAKEGKIKVRRHGNHFHVVMA